VVALRSRKLEQLFGDRLDAVPHANSVAFVNSGVMESYDLDLKATLCGSTDSDKRDLGCDVAAMANTAGGVILLGVGEDAQGRAATAPGVPLSDAEHRRIRQVVAAQVGPLPVFDIISVEDPSTPGHGFLMVAIPRSANAPHGVIINNAYRFPKRNGTTTTYLAEPQIAEAYRARFAGLATRVEGAERIERDFLGTLDTSTQVFAVVTLVPDLPGDSIVDSVTFREFEQSMIGRDPLLLKRNTSWQRATVRRRRLAADGARSNAPGSSYLAAELHHDGAGSFAAVVDLRRDDQELTNVEDEVVINAVAGGLRLLARHARDRAAAGGMATVRATVWPIDTDHPARLFHNSGFRRGPWAPASPPRPDLGGRLRHRRPGNRRPAPPCGHASAGQQVVSGVRPARSTFKSPPPVRSAGATGILGARRSWPGQGRSEYRLPKRPCLNMNRPARRMCPRRPA
jgi:hypothetical protein